MMIDHLLQCEWYDRIKIASARTYRPFAILLTQTFLGDEVVDQVHHKQRVAVAPVITFGRNNGWVSKIYAGRSMVAKSIQVQTVSKFGQWVTIKRVRVGSGNMARFTLPLSKGVHKLRIAMSVNQAGVGYLAAFSHEITYRRTS